MLAPKDVWDFQPDESDIRQFIRSLDDYAQEFIQHHDRAKWQDDGWKTLRDNVSANGTRCDRIAPVLDYANSYAHEHRDEHM